MAENRRLLDPAVLARLSNLYLVARTVVEGSLTGLHRSLHKGSSVEFAEHREYAPGDDPRYLDWRVFGRTDRLYVKTFREETNLRSLILLDASGSMAYRGRGLSKLEYAVYLAAGLSYLMVNQKDAVGLMVFDSAVRRMVKPASTSRHLHHLLEQLQVTAAAETTNLGEVLHTIAARARRRSLIILISDLLDDPERVLKGLVHFRHKYHEVLVFQVLDPDELELPFGGPHTFLDLETGDRLETDAPAIRAEYRRLVGDFLETYRKGCAEHNISYVRALTSNPFDHFLHHYLERRARYS